jgi:hypothetical protein
VTFVGSGSGSDDHANLSKTILALRPLKQGHVQLKQLKTEVLREKADFSLYKALRQGPIPGLIKNHSPEFPVKNFKVSRNQCFEDFRNQGLRGLKFLGIKD